MNTLIEPVDQSRWHELAGTFLDYNYRQLWSFCRAGSVRSNCVPEFVAITRDDKILGLASVRIKRTPIFKTGIAYITGAPLVRRGTPTDAERLLVCLRTLIDEYVHRRKMLLRIHGPLGPPEWNNTQKDLFTGAGFLPGSSGKPYHTIIVDINRELDAIRKGFSHHWRTNLNNAEKMGLTIRMGTELEMFSDFCGLYTQLLDRKQFQVNLDPEFYAMIQAEMSGEEKFLITLAEYKGKPVSGYVASMLGDTCVLLLGASSQQGLDLRASYLLQWATLQEARRRSCRWYDLGGVDPEHNPGVFRFKSGMGGVEVTAPGPFELPPGGMNRYIAAGGERLYRAWRKVYVGGGG